MKIFIKKICARKIQRKTDTEYKHIRRMTAL